MRFQRNATLLLGQIDARRCGARRWHGCQQQCMELIGVAAAQATRQRGDVTRSSLPRLACLLERPSWRLANLVEATAASEQRGQGGRDEWATRSRWSWCADVRCR
jgi:hypothetical protein